MRSLRMRFTVGRMMGLVAVVALMLSNPVAYFILVTFAIWFSLPIVAVVLLDTRSGETVAATAAVGMVGTASWFLENWSYHHLKMPLWATSFLSPFNLLGPLYIAVRLWRGKTLLAGEILWAWVGLVWLTLWVTPDLHRMHGGRIAMLEAMVQSTRLTLALAVGLIIFGRRPIETGPYWSHYLGWVVAEGDIMAWGWHASEST